MGASTTIYGARRWVGIALAGALIVALLPMLTPTGSAAAAAPAYFTQIGSLRSAEFQGYRYFFADDDQHGLELWRTDGTRTGTGLFIDSNPGDADSDGLFPDSLNSDLSDRHFLVSTATNLYLLGGICTTAACSQDRAYQQGIYRVDIAAKKLVLVSDRRFATVANIGNRVLLQEFYTDKIFSLDAETGALSELTAFRALNFDVLHRDLSAAVVKGVAYFSASDSDRDDELWRSDGTSAGTYRVKNIRASTSSYPGSFVAGTSRFYFLADDGFSGQEIWTSDGTSAGTTRLSEHGVGTAGASLVVNMPYLVTVGDRLYYYLSTPKYGAELWTATGTRASVSLVRDLGAGTANANLKHMTKLGDKLAFFRPGTSGDDLWVTNGTSAGTVKVAAGTNLGTTPNASPYYRAQKDEPAVVAGQLVYNRSLSGAQNIWQSGNVAQTTKRIASHTGLTGRPAQLLPVGSRVFYAVPTRVSTFAPTHYVPQFATITPLTPPAKLTKTPIPKVSGTATIGKTLTAVAGTWAPSKVTLKYQWLRNGATIATASKSTYKLVKADAGKKISVKVTGTKAGYAQVSKVSAPATALYALTKTPVPKISGAAKVGKTVKAMPGTWSPSKVTLKYQWLRNGKAISKATKSTYKLVATDKGKKVSVKVTGSKSTYKSVAKTSAAKKVT